MRIQHWQDVASLVVGAWLVVSPFVLGMAGAAVWLTIALGLGVILFAVEAFVIPSYLEEWGEMLLGLALVVCTVDGRLRAGRSYGEQRVVGPTGDPVCCLGADDGS